jgi:hypothetical protein
MGRDSSMAEPQGANVPPAPAMTESINAASGAAAAFNQFASTIQEVARAAVQEAIKETGLGDLAVQSWLYTIKNMDPESYAAIVAASEVDLSVYDPVKGALYDEAYDDAKAEAEAVSPIFQLDQRLAELESVLGVGQTTDDAAATQQNAVAALEKEQHTQSIDIATLKGADIGMTIDISAARQLAYDAKQMAENALREVRSRVNLRWEDTVTRKADHNQHGGSEVVAVGKTSRQ